MSDFWHDVEVREENRSLVQGNTVSVAWRQRAYEVLRELARSTGRLTATDLWDQLDTLGIPRPVRESVADPVFHQAVREGWLIPTGYVRTSGGRQRVYRPHI